MMPLLQLFRINNSKIPYYCHIKWTAPDKEEFWMPIVFAEEAIIPGKTYYASCSTGYDYRYGKTSSSIYRGMWNPSNILDIKSNQHYYVGNGIIVNHDNTSLFYLDMVWCRKLGEEYSVDGTKRCLCIDYSVLNSDNPFEKWFNGVSFRKALYDTYLRTRNEISIQYCDLRNYLVKVNCKETFENTNIRFQKMIRENLNVIKNDFEITVR